MAGIDRATLLYYSDDPEQLNAVTQGHVDGVVFDFDLVAGPPQRFVLYHVNADAAQRTLALRFLNQGGSNVRVSYIGALPAAAADYMSVGHDSTFGFLQALVANAPVIVDVGPNQNVVPLRIPVPYLGLASGIFEFTLVAGAALRVSLVSSAQPDDIVSVAQAGNSFTLDNFGRRGKFDISNNPTVVVTAVAGSPLVVTRLGERTFANLAKTPGGAIGNALKGEYGVFTAIDLTITNPNPAAATVALYESAHGGDSTASYLIDGQLATSGVMRSANPYPRYKLKTFNVPANGQITSSILTMPDNGSNSPVVLFLDNDDPALAAPNSPGSIVAYEP